MEEKIELKFLSHNGLNSILESYQTFEGKLQQDSA